MSRITLLDVIKRNNSDAIVGLIDETVQNHPELRLGDARTIVGTGYDTRVRIELPSAAFRKANDGTDATRGRSENRRVETHIIDVRAEVDKAVADRSEDGPLALLAEEGEAQVSAAFKHVAKQFYYGTAAGGDALGHPGLIQSHDSNVVVDAGGTTDDVATSVWAVRFGPQAVRWILGAGGTFAVSDPRVETITGENAKPLTGYVQTLLAYVGLQVGSLKSVGRIKKVTTDSGKTLTDNLIAQLLTKFSEQNGAMPDVLFMTPRSLEQLRTSRTATNATGAPAPVPDSSMNIPIAATNSILNTEKLAL